MQDLIKKTINAKRESKYIEFKVNFDPHSIREWCEIIKDIVAISNSGGGAILFGVDNQGKPQPVDLSALSKLDPADIANKLSKYIGNIEIEIQVSDIDKEQSKLVIFIIIGARMPIVFSKPGQYPIESGKQNTAFSQGTVYFRHGAKSEPGTTEDIRRSLDKQLNHIQKVWMKNVRKVVAAPQNSEIVMIKPTNDKVIYNKTMRPIRIVKDSRATPVYLTREEGKATGIYVHEQLDQNIFDEINNVVNANALLAGDTKEFVLGESVYYRIYAERQHVKQSKEFNLSLLFNAFTKQYVPFLFWVFYLPNSQIARILAQQYFHPKSPFITSMLRMSICLNDEYNNWLDHKMKDKWNKQSQPPSFYWAYKRMISQRNKKDFRLIAINKTYDTQIVLNNGNYVKLNRLLDDPEQCSNILSGKCMEVSNGNLKVRPIARELDIIAYGQVLRKKSSGIFKEIKKIVGDELPGDPPDYLNQQP